MARQTGPKPELHDSGPLAKHADGKDTIEFTEEVKHGRLRFHKGMVVKFEDPAVAAYFDVAFNGTEFTSKAPTWEVTSDDLNFDKNPENGETIDPNTVIGTGREGIPAGATIQNHLKPPKVASKTVDGAPLKVKDVNQGGTNG